MKRTMLLLLILALLWGAAPSWGASTDLNLPYQKTLTAAPPVVGTLTPVTFSLYDSANNTGSNQLVWSESKNMNMLATTRLIAHTLGSVKVLTPALFTNQQLWVEVKIGDVVVGSRDKLNPAPYALWSANAAVADSSITGAKLAQMEAIPGQTLAWNGTSWAPASVGSGSVTSVGLALPDIISVSNSPVTTSGTLTGTLAGQLANRVFAAPDGAAGTPGFRALVAADIPTLNQNTTGTAAGLTAQYVDWNAASGGASIANKPAIPAGGAPALTLGTTNTAGSASTFVRTDATILAFDSTVPAVAGTAAAGSATVAARRDHVHPAQTNISGNAANVTGTVAVGNGGTGTTTAPTQGGIIYATSSSAYASTGAGTSGQILQSNGTGAPTWQSKAYGVFAVRTHSGTDLNIAYTSIGANGVIPFDTTITGNLSLNNGQITLNANTTYEIDIIIPYTNTTGTAMAFRLYDNNTAAYVPSQALVLQVNFSSLVAPAVMKTIYTPAQTAAIDVRNTGGVGGALNVTYGQLSNNSYGPYIVIKQL